MAITLTIHPIHATSASWIAGRLGGAYRSAGRLTGSIRLLLAGVAAITGERQAPA